ncbi:MAG: outer membrane beta-barrel protein [Bacteroidetes bacterium]|nr:outer membrane beta-barrel protein [Bacteroidota bacterium]
MRLPLFKPLLLVALALACVGVAAPATAQSNAFRASKVHLGAGLGYFSYYGPRDLTQERSRSNDITRSSSAGVLLGSFPLNRHLFFRGMVGTTSLNADSLLGTAETNEFLTERLYFFEPEVVYVPGALRESRVMPYIYTGFGALMADPFRRRQQPNTPGTGQIGPERTVWALPIGAGLDVAFTPRVSAFVDASYRFNFSYVANTESRVQDINPHNTSLVMAGLRWGLGARRVRVPTAQAPPPPLPPAIEIPPYQPPITRPDPRPRRCELTELNTIYFNVGQIVIAGQSRGLLDANVQAIKLNAGCCIEIVGYTDTETGAEAVRVSQARAQALYDAYVQAGIDPSKLRLRAGGIGPNSCSKGEGPGCPRNRRVESRPAACQAVQDVGNN